MFDEFLSKASELWSAESPFAVAIVVKSEPPVSGKPGDKAIIQSNGTVWGWVGGGCVQPLVIREALKAIDEGNPRLVRISPSPEAEPASGVVNYPMSCHGGGSLQVYIEPILPKSQILIVGNSAAARSLSKLGKAVGYKICVVAAEASRENFPDADYIGKEINRTRVNIESETYIVVATQGEHDEEALEQALATNARYISFIASQAKAAKVIDCLSRKGFPPEMLKRIKAPAGLHIGTLTSQEIAISILAEIIQVKRGNATGFTMEHDLNRDHDPLSVMATDPVCGMTIETEATSYTSEYHGKLFYFCCAGCKQAFETNPQKYT